MLNETCKTNWNDEAFLEIFYVEESSSLICQKLLGHNSRTRFFHDTPFSKKLGRPLVLSCSEKKFARRNNISKKTRKFSFFGLPDPEWLFYFSTLYVQKNQKKLMNIKVNDVCKLPTSTIITICGIIFLKLTISWWTKNLRKSNLINHFESFISKTIVYTFNLT